MNEIDRQKLDYLVFGKTLLKGPTPKLSDFSADAIYQHVKTRLQLDFLDPDFKLIAANGFIMISHPHWHDGDFVQHAIRPNVTLAAHLNVDPPFLLVPQLHDGHDYDVMDLSIVISSARTNFTPYDNVTRFARLPGPVAELTALPKLVAHLNHMYAQPLFRLNLVLDAGMLIGQLTLKQLSYLKTEFRQNFGLDNCRLFLTNSRGQLGRNGLAVTPFAVKGHELGAQDFLNWLYSADFKPNNLAQDHAISLHQVMAYHDLPQFKHGAVQMLGETVGANVPADQEMHNPIKLAGSAPEHFDKPIASQPTDPQPKVMLDPKAKTETETEPKVAVKSQKQAKPKPVQKPAAKPQAKAAAKTLSEPAAKAKAKSAPKASVKPAPKAAEKPAKTAKPTADDKSKAKKTVKVSQEDLDKALAENHAARAKVHRDTNLTVNGKSGSQLSHAKPQSAPAHIEHPHVHITPSSEREAMQSYVTDSKPSDVLKRHLSKSNTFDPSVKIIKAAKPETKKKK